VRRIEDKIRWSIRLLHQARFGKMAARGVEPCDRKALARTTGMRAEDDRQVLRMNSKREPKDRKSDP
jgi:hypothetical protein